jgi:low temperature requirement protein LtrA
VLGEVVAATAAAVQTSLGHTRASAGLLTVAAAGLLLVFALWWSYFKHSAAEQIRQSLPWTFVWAFGHYLILASVAPAGRPAARLPPHRRPPGNPAIVIRRLVSL